MYNQPSSQSTNKTPERIIYSVSDLNRQVRMLLETQLPLLWIEGEISNFARPRSGHWYLTLKDNQAQVRCAMFKNRNMGVHFQPQDGQQVLVRARAGLYEGRGEFQLIIEHMEEAGLGALQRQFDALKAKLEHEGLFNAGHKQEVPALPEHIGVITSPTGAAVHDILTVLKRRFPSIPVSVIPTAVQGAEAIPQIIHAIELANKKTICDVIILGRGGGSLEDLWCFNEEAVARAIFNSGIPIVSAVGHEVDFTIADFVADVRAPTPSAAAEMLSPDQWELQNQFHGFSLLLEQALERKFNALAQQLDHLASRLRHPKELLRNQRDKLAHLQHRLEQAIATRLSSSNQQLALLELKQQQQHPSQRLSQIEEHLTHLSTQLYRAIETTLSRKNQQFEQQAAVLHSVSPLQTLQRGYSITKSPQGKVISQTKKLNPGDRITTELQDGELTSIVEAIQSK